MYIAVIKPCKHYLLCFIKLTTCGEHIVHIDGVTGSSPTVTTKAQPLKIKGCNFFNPSASLSRGSLRRRERLEPPFRSHGRLAQLPENRGGLVGGNEAAFVSLLPSFLANRCPDKLEFVAPSFMQRILRTTK